MFAYGLTTAKVVQVYIHHQSEWWSTIKAKLNERTGEKRKGMILEKHATPVFYASFCIDCFNRHIHFFLNDFGNVSVSRFKDVHITLAMIEISFFFLTFGGIYYGATEVYFNLMFYELFHHFHEGKSVNSNSIMNYVLEAIFVAELVLLLKRRISLFENPKLPNF